MLTTTLLKEIINKSSEKVHLQFLFDTDPDEIIYTAAYGIDCPVNGDLISGDCIITVINGGSNVEVKTENDFEINDIGIHPATIEMEQKLSGTLPSGDNYVDYELSNATFQITDGGFSSIIILSTNPNCELKALRNIDVGNNNVNPLLDDDDIQIINACFLLSNQGTIWRARTVDLQISFGQCGEYCPFGGSIEFFNASNVHEFTMHYGSVTGNCGDQILITFENGDPDQFIDCAL